jgi:ribosomal 50S subunit-recycling heat shock protein
LRVDLFLKLVGVAKTRMAAKRMCEAGLVLREGRTLKPSDEVLPGQALDLSIPEREGRLQVLALPAGRSVARKDRSLYAAFG